MTIDEKLREKTGKGLSRNDFDDLQKGKLDNSPYDCATILFNGESQPFENYFINEGGTFAWTNGNACKVVPVTAGKRIRIEGRELSPNSLTVVFLKSPFNGIGNVPDFVNGNFANSSFVGDGDYVVPQNATHMYILAFSNVQSSTKIFALDSGINTDGFLIKTNRLPNRLYKKVEDAYKRYIDGTKRQNLVITKNSYVAIGRDVSLYFDSQITQYDSVRNMFLTAYSESSNILRANSGIRYKPLTSTTDIGVIYTLRDYLGNQLASFEKKIKTVQTGGGAGRVVNIMHIGDSYPDTGIYVTEVSKLLRLDGYVINELGTQLTKYSDPKVNCEGRSGWTINNYVNDNSATVGTTTLTNPFRLNGVLNFSNYLSANNIVKPDIVVLHISINDVGGFGSEQPDSTFNQVSANMRAFISKMQTDWVGTKIIVCLPHLGAYQFSTARNIQDFRSYNLARMGKKIIDVFDENRFSPNVFVCDANQSIHRREGHIYTTESVSSRINTYTERIYTDVVHPSADISTGQGGYYQFADNLYSQVLWVIKNTL